jgi:small nuclear ribonucleoprotein G
VCLSISSVKLNANRVVIGTLRGFDQFMNLVVDNTVEVNGNDKTDIGMVVSFLLLKIIWNLWSNSF